MEELAECDYLEIFQTEMKLKEFNNLGSEKVREDLFKCCGSKVWADKLMTHFPFSSIEDLKICSDMIWFSCSEEDWLEAFSHHPKIGEKAGVDKKHESTREWAQNEQSGVRDAEKNILFDLVTANESYLKKFGYIFIVCATGKSASEMLSILKERLNNDAEKEMHIAAGEQNKITHLRIDKLLS